VYLPLGREATHVGGAGHNVNGLLEPPKHRVLDVGHPMLGADGADKRGCLLIAQHREVRPEVMLDLVVKPTMVEIDEVGAHREISRGDDLAEVKGGRARLTMAVESVEVITRVVGHDDEERVQIREDLGQQERYERIEDGCASENEASKAWQHHKLPHKERAKYAAKESGQVAGKVIDCCCVLVCMALG